MDTLQTDRAAGPVMTWTQLEPGTLVAERQFLKLGSLVLGRRRHDAAFHGNGAVPEGYTLFGSIESGAYGTRWSGVDVTRDDVAVTRNRVDLSTTGPQTFYTIAVRDADVCYEYPSAAVVCGSFGAIPNKPALFRSAHAGRLRSYVGRLFDDRLVRNPRSRRTIGAHLLWLLAAAVGDEGRVVEPSRPQTRRIAAVRLCCEYIADQMGEAVTLLDLSNLSGLRPRSLINAFEAVTGMSPMAYLRAQRLNRVRAALESARHAKVRVIDVAADWGFWHMGHFAAAYRAMFGETPSETLLRERTG